MQSNILPFTPSRAAFIRNRLRVEAVLVYLGLTVRVRQGYLFILGEIGEMAAPSRVRRVTGAGGNRGPDADQPGGKIRALARD